MALPGDAFVKERLEIFERNDMSLAPIVFISDFFSSNSKSGSEIDSCAKFYRNRTKDLEFWPRTIAKLLNDVTHT